MREYIDCPEDWELFMSGEAVLLCPTEELAESLLALCRLRGMEWRNSESLSINHWEDYKEQTCYKCNDRSKLSYGTPRAYEELTILEYSCIPCIESECEISARVLNEVSNLMV